MGKHAQIIKLDATDSTNRYLKDQVGNGSLGDCSVVWAERQWSGRGQRGAVWESETGKNLTFSMLKRFDALAAESQFMLTMAVSLAICEVLRQLSIPNVKIKWPNDIMSGNRKICGILIESVLKGPWIQHAIIGIGLNVNQDGFGKLSRAGSLRSVGGAEFVREDVLHSLILHLRAHLGALEQRTVGELMPAYGTLLFRKDLPSAFKKTDGQPFMGIVRGVGDQGRLLIEHGDGTIMEVGLKEVSMLY